MHGDLLYVFVVTLEDKRFHITASTRGFFVNQTTEEEFNPRPAPSNYLSHSLIELLNQISPGFKRNLAILQKRRTSRHPFERVATPYQVHHYWFCYKIQDCYHCHETPIAYFHKHIYSKVYTWLAPHQEHTIDAIRAEDAFSSKLGYEEHIPGQTRDWNEELQTTRELPRKNLPERLLRERAIFKVSLSFEHKIVNIHQ